MAQGSGSNSRAFHSRLHVSRGGAESDVMNHRRALAAFLCTALASSFALVDPARGASKDLGKGFRDHGVAAPISQHRGLVATVDGEGNNVVLLWLMDHRGGYALLLLDATTGKVEQFPMPFDQDGDSPYASILSSANKLYTHYGNHFVEFDPVKRAFTFHKETSPQMAMSMTEDDQGTIWSVTFPQSGVASYNPKTGAFRDYGHVYKQDWKQYPRHIAADDAGWIYFGVGMTNSQIVSLDPKTGKATPVLEEGERKKGVGYVYRDLDGKVYGQAVQDKENDWYELHKGVARKLGAGEHKSSRPKPFIAGSQTLSHMTFHDGTRAAEIDLTDRRFVVEDPKTKKRQEYTFEYTSEGAIVMGAAVSPDGTILGGTAFPMRCFRYDPKADAITNRAAFGQWNTTAVQRDHFIVGGYPEKDKSGNPQHLTDSHDVHRPTALLPHPDGHTVILAGTPNYGFTGGGMLFWDRDKPAKEARTLLTDAQLIPDHSTESLVALPASGGAAGEKLLGGTTTAPGSGGQKKATVAELYVMDFASRKIEWRAPLMPGVQEYTALWPGPRGLIYGIADARRFFVFDPSDRTIKQQREIGKDLGPTAHQQGPRPFVNDKDGQTYLICRKAVARIDPTSFELTPLATSPIPIESGGAYLDGRVYFITGSHLYSYELPSK
jgi:hypothetical protein